MTHRENLLSLIRREGPEWVPVSFSLCPSLEKKYIERVGASPWYDGHFQFPWRNIGDIRLPGEDYAKKYARYYPGGYKKGTHVDHIGVAHEPGSEAAMHMTYMRHPLEHVKNAADIKEYPFPDFPGGETAHQKAQAEEIHARGLAAVGDMPCTIWETAWYIRGMENLMMDMMEDNPTASYLLDAVTRNAVSRARAYAAAGADILSLGDDVGMQSRIMISEELYRKWLWPRLKLVIDEARSVKPDIIVFYHSCGYVTPFIPLFIKAGIDVLTPVQPESMDFTEICGIYGDRLSFHGAIGTQSVMPFGTPGEVKDKVWEYLSIAGPKGGLFPAPTHLLEPEVPWENVEAYVQACNEYRYGV
ncbi:MAG: hypothetical protein FWE91_08530 [Defluviitaleaceae bacterium]|nr:hypothetical protein [Defluviitaleaceae bacterium]MCL2835266.1 hypothetical protein [Defluviitaleaceae bacterium]